MNLSCQLFLAVFWTQCWSTSGFVLSRPLSTTSGPQFVLETTSSATASESSLRNTTKQQLLVLLNSVPRNSQTSRRQTRKILDQVQQLEPHCPTDPSKVLAQSAGNWELTWTAQDQSTTDDDNLSRFLWINPLENQAYSNNPAGRANPLLPVPIQNMLTDRGILSKPESVRTSTQTIDVAKQQVINVVTLPLPQGKATLTVRVEFTPHPPDPRRVNVKFQSFAVRAAGLRFDLPLGIVGPTGWLRTTYVDDSLRITRGHKGSVFILQRRRKSTSPRS